MTGDVTAQGNLTQSGAGTFSTGTGTVSLNGDTTVVSGKDLTLASYTTNGTLLYTNGSGVVTQLSAQGNASVDCLISQGAGNAPAFSSCADAVASSIYWNQQNGAVFTKNDTVDLLLGSNATDSAKFAVIGINNPRGQQTASVSGNLVLDAQGSLQTTNNQTLTIGGDTTGNVIIDSNTSLISLLDNTSITGTLDTTGNITTAGDLAVNGGDITTNQTTANLFNTTATTLNIGGAATTLSLGNSTGTTTINSTTLSLPNATAINAGSALLTIDSLQVGGGYGSTGVSISNTGNIQANGTLTIDGASVFGGTINANSGTINTNQTTANLFNTTATTLNIGGAATALSLGNSTGTTTINSTTLSLPNATAINAGSALLTIDSLQVGGGYGSTGVSISNTGNIQANGTLTIDGASVLTGNVTAGADLAVNGGDITTTSTTANLFNTTATTLNIGGAATTISLGAGSGTTTVNNDLAVSGTLTSTGLITADGGLTVSPSQNFIASGSSLFSPDVTNDVTFITDADSTIVISGLQTTNGTALCLDGSDNLVYCTGAPFGLQAAYNTGNTITTTNARDIAFTLADTATDSNFTVTSADGSTGYAAFLRADGTGTSDPLQLVLLDNQDTDRVLPTGLRVSSTGGGGVTTAIDLSDASIVTALSLGANDVSATNFSIDGATGNITTAGDLAVNGGDITTSQTTFNLLDTTATTLNIGGASTTISLGAGSGTTTVNNNLAVSGTLTSTGLITANGGLTVSPSQNFIASGSSLFSPDVTNDVTFITDADSTIVISGLQTTSGTVLCLDGSDNLVNCDNNTISLQGAYNAGNTITTTNARDIAFTLYDESSDAGGSTSFTLTNAGTANAFVLNDTNTAVNNSLVIQSGGINKFIIDENGNATSSGNFALNGGSLTTSQTTFNLLDTTATTLNIGGAATALSLGNSTGTTTINSTTLSLPNATAINAGSALLTIDSLQVGGGYGSTGVSISNTGNIQANGTLTIDGASVLTGNVTAGADLAVNGGDITTTSTTANLFNTTATTLNIGGAATTISLGAGSGTTTVNNDLAVSGTLTSTGLITADGGLTVSPSQNFIASGSSLFSPDVTNDVTFITDADSTIVISGLQTTSGTVLCLDGSDNLVNCDNNTISLQGAYNAGNTITTTNARDIAFTLADTATDSNFTVTSADGSTGYAAFLRADGTGTSDPSQLVLIDNQDTDRVLPTGLRVSSTGGGGVTTAIDLSDASIVTALSLGANDVSATNFSIDGATGNITTAGDLAVNGGDITTSQTTFNLLDTTATTLNIGGASTTISLGAGSGTTTVNNNLAVSGTLTSTGLITANGGATVSTGQTFTANGISTFSPDSTNDVTINTDADSFLSITGLTTVNGSTLCLDASNNVVLCSADSITLQSAYNGGNTITTTNARDIAFTLADTATDSNFTVTSADGSTGYAAFLRADGTGTSDPSQLVLIDNQDTDRVLPTGLRVSSTGGGGVTTAIDLSDASIVTALSLGANDVSATNFSIDGATGNITTAGDLAVNGGDITTSQTTFNLLDTTATTLNIGGASTTISLGAGSGTATINNATVNFANATSFTANSALASFDSLQVGGGYGSTGVSISNTGNIQANGTLTIDGASVLTGNVTAGADLAVNGGDITTSQTTFNLLDTTATTLNIGGASTTISLGAGSGTTTVNNNLAVSGTLTSTGLITANGGATVSTGQTFTANGISTFSPDSTNDVTINTDADSFLSITGLTTVNGSTLCLDASNNVVLCSADSITLQSAYNGGNTITTTNARDIAFTLADTATDSNFTVTSADGSTGYAAFLRENGTGTNDPSQLVLIDNQDTDRVLPTGLRVSSTGGGGVTTAIDLSDASIVTALSLGANDVSATHFSFTGSNGNFNTDGTITATGDITTTANLAVNGGDITTTSTTANLFNTTATTLNIGGAATTLSLGNSTGTTTINSTTLSLPNATAINAGSALLTIDSLQVGGGYGSTGVSISNTGNIQANGTLTIDGASLLTGDVTAQGNLTQSGAGTFSTGTGTVSLNGDTTVVSGKDLTLASYTTNGTLLYTNGSGVVTQLSAQGNASVDCLISQGAGNAPAFSSCADAVASSIYWNQQNGAVFTKNDTVDLLLGSNATDSAKFAVIGINNPRGQQTASVSGNLVLDAQGSLQTTNNQTLTIGGDTTGNVNLQPLGGAGEVNVDGIIDTNQYYKLGDAKVLDIIGVDSLVIGTGAGTSLTGNYNTLIGQDAGQSLTNNTSNTFVGYSAGYYNTGDYNTYSGYDSGFGNSGNSEVYFNTGFGYNALKDLTTGDDYNSGFGYQSGLGFNGGSYNLFLGGDTTATDGISSSIVLGYNANATASNQFVIGNSFSPINDVYLGEGVTSTSPQNITINATGGSGTDVAGADIIFAGSRATGNADGGDVVIKTAFPGTSGTSLQSLTEVARFLDEGNFSLGSANGNSQLYVTRPLSFGATGKALAIFDQIENQDILTASYGGTTKFTIGNDGSVTSAAYTGPKCNSLWNGVNWSYCSDNFPNPRSLFIVRSIISNMEFV